MLRILHSVYSMRVGGQDMFIMNLYKKIDKNKIQFDFLISDYKKGEFEDEILSMGGKIHKFDPFKKYPLKSFFQTIIEIKRNNYKIIHHHTAKSDVFIPLLADMIGGAELRIAHSHSTSTKKIFLHKLMRPLMNMLTTNRFACSNEAGEWLFGKNKKFDVINNGIDTSRFIYNQNIRESIRKQLNVENKFVVGHVGWLNQVKNHTFLLDIFAEIHKQKPDSVLLLVGGDGGLQNEIEGKIERLNLKDSVILTGIRKDANDLFQAMDVFLLPSLYEGLPIVLVEAQTSGLHSITSSVVSPQTKITDLLEYISLDETPEYWANKALQYANGYERKNMQEEIINKGFDISHTAKVLEEFYLKCGERKKHGK